MKNLIITATISVAMLLPTAAAFAAVSCGVQPDGSIVQCGNGSPEMVMNVWGGTNSDVPHVQPGQSVTDQWGNVSVCPAWFTDYCVDISHTQYYIGRHA